jgi:hypothetical protein
MARIMFTNAIFFTLAIYYVLFTVNYMMQEQIPEPSSPYVDGFKSTLLPRRIILAQLTNWIMYASYLAAFVACIAYFSSWSTSTTFTIIAISLYIVSLINWFIYAPITLYMKNSPLEGPYVSNTLKKYTNQRKPTQCFAPKDSHGFVGIRK